MSNKLKTIQVKEKINVSAIKHIIAKNDTAKQNELLDEGCTTNIIYLEKNCLFNLTCW